MHFYVQLRDAATSMFVEPVHSYTACAPQPGKRSRTLADIFLQFTVIAILAVAMLFVLLQLAHAGGPKYVAGASFFDPVTKGSPLTWAGGALDYYTDQGDLSPLLQHAAADSLVNTAFSRWTSVPTAALLATLRGQLSEDVNGSNVTNVGGVISLPVDIQPSATNEPIAIVYDSNGAVTDALLGAGAATLCFSNGVFGGIDNFTTDGHFSHALIVMNGQCAQTSSQLPDLQYQLVRVVGRVTGLDWSQLNTNVITGSPLPLAADFAGFPVMHAQDPISCVPISVCYPNADQLTMDDRAAISRLYPVTPANQASFPGKTPFAANTARIHGTISFADAVGNATQGMQGVNVVARWIDVSNQPSRQYATSSVSGFLFRGNAGNLITGYTNPAGQPRDRFGSDDTSVEGAFDLAGLEFPAGGNSARYELSVEALDTTWSRDVGPYAPWQVNPSGAAQPVIVTVSRGGNVQQDLVMAGSAPDKPDVRGPESFLAPATTASGGDWFGSLSGYGDSDFFKFPGQINRTMSVEVTSLDETGAATQQKARPVIGMWSLAAPPGTAPGAATPTSFNVLNFGMTRLDAVLQATTDFRIGVADERGDGRPDYRYRIRVLYGDHVTPTRVGVGGGDVFAIDGMGFRPGMTVNVSQRPATVLDVTPGRIIASAPAVADGSQTVTLNDPISGGSSTLTNVLTTGAAASDLIMLLSGANPAIPVGTPSQTPVRVRAVRSDGITPVAGASVNFSVTPAAAFSACGGGNGCTIVTDENGEASTNVTPLSVNTFTITAALAPASYSPAKYVQSTLVSRSSSLDIAVVSPYRWIAQAANVDVPLTAVVVGNGLPLSGKTVNFTIVAGTGTLTAGSVTTGSNGYATTTLQLRNAPNNVRVSACVAPASPCATLYVTGVGMAALGMQIVSGSAQMAAVGQPFRPVVVRVTDSGSPPNPVQGAAVNFWSVVFRPDNDVVNEPASESGGKNPSIPIILGSTQQVIYTDTNGLAGLTPSAGGVSGAVEIEIMATAGTTALQQFELESVLAAGVGGAAPGGSSGSLRPLAPKRQVDEDCSENIDCKVRFHVVPFGRRRGQYLP